MWWPRHSLNATQRGIAQVYLRADQQVRMLVESARAHGRTRTNADGRCADSGQPADGAA